eukprot:2617903-Rhodomonas_salina.1
MMTSQPLESEPAIIGTARRNASSTLNDVNQASTSDANSIMSPGYPRRLRAAQHSQRCRQTLTPQPRRPRQTAASAPGGMSTG